MNILVMDDDPQVLNSVQSSFKMFGLNAKAVPGYEKYNHFPEDTIPIFIVRQ